MLKGHEVGPNEHKSGQIYSREHSCIFWHKTMKGIKVEVSESGVGGMVTVNHEARTSNKTRGNPELLRCAISGAEFEQS
jgi:hypothetical protein